MPIMLLQSSPLRLVPPSAHTPLLCTLQIPPPPQVWLYRDKQTGMLKGDATVTFEDPFAAASAPSWFNGKPWSDGVSVLSVSLAQKQEAAGGGYGGGGYGGGGGGYGGGGGGYGGGGVSSCCRCFAWRPGCLGVHIVCPVPAGAPGSAGCVCLRCWLAPWRLPTSPVHVALPSLQYGGGGGGYGGGGGGYSGGGGGYSGGGGGYQGTFGPHKPCSGQLALLCLPRQHCQQLTPHSPHRACRWRRRWLWWRWLRWRCRRRRRPWRRPARCDRPRGRGSAGAGTLVAVCWAACVSVLRGQRCVWVHEFRASVGRQCACVCRPHQQACVVC